MSNYDPPSQPDQPQYPYQPQPGQTGPDMPPPPQYPYPQQPNTQYPPQQPYPQYPQQPYGQYDPTYASQQPPMLPPMPPPAPPKKRVNKWFAIGCGGLLVLAVAICAISAAANNSATANTTSTTPQATTVSDQSAPTDTPVPTDTPMPTPSAKQVEQVYKATTMNTTVDNIDKQGNNYKDKDLHFTCKILKFVKDDSGNTAGANVESPDTYSGSVVQIGFPSNTDLNKLNEGDTIEVWGSDQGVFSGQNALGGTVQEVAISAQYLTDQTTGYRDNG
jgi:hypothetical protein